MNRKIILTALALTLCLNFATGSKAYGAEELDWEINITAITETGAGNKISIGQNNSATNGFDGYFDTPARLEGDISAYIDNADWGEDVKKYWRDIKAPNDIGSWTFNVSTVLNDTDITLSWDTGKLDVVNTATLKDNVTGAVVNMKKEGSYTYTNTGPATFTVVTTPYFKDSSGEGGGFNFTNQRRNRSN